MEPFLLVPGLERESESFFSTLTLTVVDGYTFLFAANGEGEIFQVHTYVYIHPESTGSWVVKAAHFSKK